MRLRQTSLLDTSEALKSIAGKQLANTITYLADFISQASQILRNSITFEDNVDCQVKVLSLTHAVEQVVSSDKPVQGILVIRVYSTVYAIESFGWYYNTSGQSVVKGTFTADPGESLDVKVILLF